MVGGGPSPTDCQSFLSQPFQARRGGPPSNRPSLSNLFLPAPYELGGAEKGYRKQEMKELPSTQ